MKKVIPSIIIILFIVNLGFAQKSKGEINPNNYSKSLGIELINPLRFLNEKDIVPIELRYGININNHFNLGANLNFDIDFGDFYGIDFGPNLRYYFTKRKISPFIEALSSIGYHNKKSDDTELYFYSYVFEKDKNLYYKLSINYGVEILPANKFGLEVFFGYGRINNFNNNDFFYFSSVGFRINIFH